MFPKVSKSCVCVFFSVFQREVHTDFYDTHIEPTFVLLINLTSVALKKKKKSKLELKPEVDLP